MIRVLRNAIIGIILIIPLILIALPTILTSFGFHPEYKDEYRKVHKHIWIT